MHIFEKDHCEIKSKQINKQINKHENYQKN
jgi:hypothetical protein